MILGGLDIGTTGCKLTLYNEKGEFQTSEYRKYNVVRSTSEHEVNPEDIWDAVKDILEVLTKTYKIDSFGVTSFGETFTTLDENDNVLTNGMLYTDPRGIEEAASFDRKLIETATGLVPHSMFSLPKLMWIKKNKPEIFSKVKRVLLMQDYIVYKLTGVAQIDYSLATRTMAFDINTLTWNDKILSIAGIDSSLFSKPVPTGSVAGKSNICGLKDCVIVSACHDQIASALGAGAHKAGVAIDGMGTVECITPIFNGVPEDKSIISDGYSTLPFVRDNLYCCYALNFCSGALVDWYRNNFDSETPFSTLNSYIKPETPGDLLLLPHFAGAASPYMDNDSKGVIIGLTLATQKSDVYKAVIEGITYESLINIKRLAKSGINVTELVVTGGGSKSKEWLQLKSNITGLKIRTIDAEEVGAAGTVILAGVACGAFSDLDKAREIMVSEKDVIEPDMEAHEKFAKSFLRYEKIYNTVKPIM